jgi:hypothetical protein
MYSFIALLITFIKLEVKGRFCTFATLLYHILHKITLKPKLQTLLRDSAIQNLRTLGDVNIILATEDRTVMLENTKLGWTIVVRHS